VSTGIEGPQSRPSPTRATFIGWQLLAAAAEAGDLHVSTPIDVMAGHS
jgi:hypothetical protein